MSLLHLAVNASSYVCTLLSCLWKYPWIDNVFLFNAHAYMHTIYVCALFMSTYVHDNTTLFMSERATIRSNFSK